MDWAEKLILLRQLDVAKEVGKPKLLENLQHVKSLLISLSEASEDTGEVFLLTAKAYRLKKKIKRHIQEIVDEERDLKGQIKSLKQQNRKLEKENKTLKGSVKGLEDENQELKQQISVLNAFREEQLREEKNANKKKRNKAPTTSVPSISLSSSSALAEEDEEDFDDENVDTFKVDVEEIEMPKTARREKSEITPDKSNVRMRKQSTIKVHVEQVFAANSTPPADKRSTIAVVPEKDKEKEKEKEKEKANLKLEKIPTGGSSTAIISPRNSKKSATMATSSSETAIYAQNPPTPSNVASGSPAAAPKARASKVEKSTSVKPSNSAGNVRATVDNSALNSSNSALSNSNSSISSSTEVKEDKDEAPKPGAGPAPASETPFDEEMLVDIITGLECTVKSRNWAEDDKMLIPKDYKYWYQFKVKRAGRELLKFKDFAPKVFYQMRQHWGISEEAFLKSFEFDNLKPIRGEGKSGAFFIFTKDRQFVLKTATGEERDFLWEILPYYYQYMRRNPNSLLPRFYGVYSMKHEGIGGMIRFVIMNNIFNTPFSPVEKYDLKGSTVGRFVKETKRQPGVILKDLDIVGMGRKLYLPQNLNEELVRQLKKDSDFLSTHKVMDYSLLLGVYYETDDNKGKTAQDLKALNENDSVIKSWVKNDFQQYYNGIKTVRPDGVTEVYYMGIIDILIQFEVKKKLEHLVKSIAYSSEEVSVVEPAFYSQRFFDFIIKLLVSDDQDKDDSGEDDETSSSSEEVKAKKAKKKFPSPPKALPAPSSSSSAPSDAQK